MTIYSSPSCPFITLCVVTFSKKTNIHSMPKLISKLLPSLMFFVHKMVRILTITFSMQTKYVVTVFLYVLPILNGEQNFFENRQLFGGVKWTVFPCSYSYLTACFCFFLEGIKTIFCKLYLSSILHFLRPRIYKLWYIMMKELWSQWNFAQPNYFWIQEFSNIFNEFGWFLASKSGFFKFFVTFSSSFCFFLSLTKSNFWQKNVYIFWGRNEKIWILK